MLKPSEHKEIKISEVENGFIIEKHHWIDETCANVKEQWVAVKEEKVRDIVYDILQSKDYSNMEGYCLGEKDCTFPDDNHDNHPKG